MAGKPPPGGTTSGSTESDVTMGPQDSNLFGPCMVVDTRRRCPTLASKNGTGDGSRSGPSGSKSVEVNVVEGKVMEVQTELVAVRRPEQGKEVSLLNGGHVKCSNGGLHEVVRIEENVGGDQGCSETNGNKNLGVGLKNMKGNVKKGLKVCKPVNIQDSDMVSWMEHFLENEDRTSDIHEVHVPTYVARHEAGQEGRQRLKDALVQAIALVCAATALCSPLPRHLTVWLPPIEGQYKINVDVP
ncbi:hypothetical protein V6N12_024209 [Hibiscus sabdariffa]|uniref:Uncharacterized protein n=1 Tax=Hibiscus sabdariffa TaxID=183260 RepID=A0ABR2FZW5_9ROSI